MDRRAARRNRGLMSAQTSPRIAAVKEVVHRPPVAQLPGDQMPLLQRVIRPDHQLKPPQTIRRTGVGM